MIYLGVPKIPDCHIMHRWTKAAKDVVGNEPTVDCEGGPMKISRPFKRNVLYVRALEIAKFGDCGDAFFDVALKHFKAVREELCLMADGKERADAYSSGDDAGSDRGASSMPATSQLAGLAAAGPITSDGVVMKEPLVNRPHGRPKVKRMQSFLDSGRAKKAKKAHALDVRPQGLSKQTSFCSVWKGPGRNSSTCSERSDDAKKPGAAKKTGRRQNRCRTCKELGYNSATCTQALEPVAEDEGDSDMD